MGGETEFDDILIQHGIIKDPEEDKGKEEQLVFKIQSDQSEDGDLTDDDDFFEQYKQKRISELQDVSKVQEISRPDFVKEVTEASEKQPVLVHLYQDSVEESVLMKAAMREAVKKYPGVKMLEIKADRCIPDYPETLVPTMILYSKGEIVQRITKARTDKLSSFLDAVMELDGP